MPKTVRPHSETLLPQVIEGLRSKEKRTDKEEDLLWELQKLQQLYEMLYIEKGDGYHTDVTKMDVLTLMDTIQKCAAGCDETLKENLNTNKFLQLRGALKTDLRETAACITVFDEMPGRGKAEVGPELFQKLTGETMTLPLLQALRQRKEALENSRITQERLPMLMDSMKMNDPWYVRSSAQFTAMKETMEKIAAYGKDHLAEVPAQLYQELQKTCKAYLKYKKNSKNSSQLETNRITLAENLQEFAEVMGETVSTQPGIEEEARIYRSQERRIVDARENQRIAFQGHLRSCADVAQQEHRHLLLTKYPFNQLIDAGERTLSVFNYAAIPGPDSPMGRELRHITVALMLHQQMELDRQWNGGEPGELERGLLKDAKTPQQALERLEETVSLMAETDAIRGKVDKQLRSPRKLEQLLTQHGMQRFARECLREWKLPEAERAGKQQDLRPEKVNEQVKEKEPSGKERFAGRQPGEP